MGSARIASPGNHRRRTGLLAALVLCLAVACRTPPPPPAAPPSAPPPSPPVVSAPSPAPAPVPAPVAPARPAPRVFDVAANETQLASYRVTIKDKQLGAPPPWMAQVFPERYSEAPGVFTFRGDSTRTGGAWGTCPMKERKLELVWTANTTPGKPPWRGGAGWTGQPVIVQWPDVMRHSMSKLGRRRFEKGFVEVIQGSLDGSVYFLDLRTGRATRPPIVTGNPIKGSVSLDPRAYPLLFVGQGIPQKKPIGLHVYNLITHKEVFFLSGKDKASPRRWGAFDSSGLLNRATDSYLLGGENGLFYALRLNTNFDAIKLTLKVRPEVLRYRYTPTDSAHYGIENSISVVGNLAFFADNGGTLQAIDLRTFQPVWAFPAGDDTDASIPVELEEGRPVLYTGTEVDKTGPSGKAWLRKLDGLTGQVLWERSYPCQGARTPKKVDAGVFATPLVGTGDIGDRVLFTLSRCPGFTEGLMVALDKATGEEVWRKPLDNYAWSSPTACKDEQGHTFILQGDILGTVHLLDGRTGEELDSLKLSGLIEASPAIFGDMAVLATRGQWIHGLRLR
ncbi:PQQ-binding-like beta-propeller repeat protein [Hyalangium rubrum]|uniref:PQQ-binding-like beta-propeller repeat protein n=1 Tax=Hyalangium rubrum TaxID=3103134 RepID=A0ABU5GW55_9BACT|nr:PQQ-binding-like beta-propeller repeat protein [Hyalangium sp. s54d21]MDY7225423.1 PQQ-binding-like beta-propeller repeat protein [Hyalangium sp. s54d21]